MAAEITATGFVDIYFLLCIHSQNSLLLRGCRAHLLTMVAQLAHKALCDNSHNRICDQISLHSHVRHTVQSTYCIICMQCRDNQMSCYGGLYCNSSSLPVSDLTDHNDIRVLT